MSKSDGKLNVTVALTDDDGGQHVFGPGNPVPKNLRDKITNPDVWAQPSPQESDRELSPNDLKLRGPHAVSQGQDPDVEVDEDEADYDQLGTRALRNLVRQRRAEAESSGDAVRMERLRGNRNKEGLVKLLQEDDAKVDLQSRTKETKMRKARREALARQAELDDEDLGPDEDEGEDLEDDLGHSEADDDEPDESVEDDDSDGDDSDDEDGYEAMTVEQLQDELRNRELPVSGNKDELVGRLEADDEDSED